MSIFDSFKQLNELRQMSDEIKKEEIVIEINGVRLIVDGSMVLKNISLNSELSISEQEKAIKDCFSEAAKEVQTRMAKKFMSGAH